MRSLLIKAVNLYLYSSLHIGVCCVLLYLFSMDRLGLHHDVEYAIFLFSSTIFTYSIHRIIGMKKVSAFAHQGRFAIIMQYRSHIIGYALISGVLCIYIYLQFFPFRMWYLGIAGLISILYTLPIFGKTKRLRDFAFIKIFLIAIVWSMVSETIILLEARILSTTTLILFVERFFFFIGITIPFDIRDRQIDKSNNVATIATLISARSARALAIGAICISMIMEVILYSTGRIDALTVIATTAAYLLTSLLIWIVLRIKVEEDTSTAVISNRAHVDYLYTGVLDGAIMLPYISLHIMLLCTA